MAISATGEHPGVETARDDLSGALSKSIWTGVTDRSFEWDLRGCIDLASAPSMAMSVAQGV